MKNSERTQKEKCIYSRVVSGQGLCYSLLNATHSS